MNESRVTKGVIASIEFNGHKLSFFLLPNGEKRVATETVGPALGYTTDWFYKQVSKNPKMLKKLNEKGFSGKQMWVKELDLSEQKYVDKQTSVESRTISLRDFNKIVSDQAISKKNIKAIILLAAFSEIGLEKVVDDLFEGRSIDFLLEKIVHYSKWTYEDWQQALADNREDVAALYSWSNPDRELHHFTR